MVKADTKVKYDGTEAPQKYTYFEELQTQVEVLQENLDEIADILQDNNLVRRKEVEAPHFDWDEVYKRLEEK